MSWLSKIFRRAPAVSPELVQQVVDVIGGIVDRVRDRNEARERIARAARRGDLDFMLDAVEADRRRAESYVAHG